MIVVMKPGATERQINHIIERVEQLGLRSHVIVGTERTVIAALGEKRDGAKQALETISPDRDWKSATIAREKSPQKRPFCWRAVSCGFRKTGWWLERVTQ